MPWEKNVKSFGFYSEKLNPRKEFDFLFFCSLKYSLIAYGCSSRKAWLFLRKLNTLHPFGCSQFSTFFFPFFFLKNMKESFFKPIIIIYIFQFYVLNFFRIDFKVKTFNPHIVPFIFNISHSFKLYSSFKADLSNFTDFLYYFKPQIPLNPYTKKPVLLFFIATLKQYELFMNFCCSLRAISFNPLSFILIAVDKISFNVFLRYNFRVFFFDFGSFKENFDLISKFRIVIAREILKAGIECLYSDIDIEFFTKLDDYLYHPQTFDIAFWHEYGGPIILTTHPMEINTGFFRCFPTKGALHFLDVWAFIGSLYPNLNDQFCLTPYMLNKKELFCDFDPLKPISDGFWTCNFYDIPIKFHIFANQKLAYGHNFFEEEKELLDLRKRKIFPTILHLTYLAGVGTKYLFLNISDLWFYNLTTHQCLTQPIQIWNNYFHSTQAKLLKSPLFSIGIPWNLTFDNKNVENYPIVRELNEWLLFREKNVFQNIFNHS